MKDIRLCEGSEEIYARSKAILIEKACIYEINTGSSIFIDEAYHSLSRIA